MDQNVRRVSDVVSVEIILGGHVKCNLTGNTEYMGVALLPPLFLAYFRNRKSTGLDMSGKGEREEFEKKREI